MLPPTGVCVCVCGYVSSFFCKLHTEAIPICSQVFNQFVIYITLIWARFHIVHTRGTLSTLTGDIYNIHIYNFVQNQTIPLALFLSQVKWRNDAVWRVAVITTMADEVEEALQGVW